MAFSEGQSYTELATEMGAQVLCGMRKDTKKKKQQQIQKASGREVPASSLEATAVYGTFLSVMVLLVACLKYRKVNVV